MTKEQGAQGKPGIDTTPSTVDAVVSGPLGVHFPAGPQPSAFAQRDLRLVSAVRSLRAESVADLLHTSSDILPSEKRIDVNTQDEDGMTALHHAAALGARPCVRLLVASGKCDYLLRDNQGRYAFELAIEWAHDYAVARLLAKKQAQQAASRGEPAFVPRAGSPAL
jgi:ankyrin repeat protein